MRLKGYILPLLLLLCLAGPASAEEIIYFANGTSMPIRSHEVKGEMIHVDLGSDSFMAFPLKMVEKIEAAGKEVSLRPSFSGGTNVMTGRVPTPEGNYPVKGSYSGHRGKNADDLPRIISRDEMNERKADSGLQVSRPMSGHEAQNRRALGVTGRGNAIGTSGGGEKDGEILGTRKVGTRNVIGGNDRRRGPDGKPLPAAPLTLSRSSASSSKKGGSSN